MNTRLQVVDSNFMDRETNSNIHFENDELSENEWQQLFPLSDDEWDDLFGNGVIIP